MRRKLKVYEVRKLTSFLSIASRLGEKDDYDLAVMNITNASDEFFAEYFKVVGVEYDEFSVDAITVVALSYKLFEEWFGKDQDFLHCVAGVLKECLFLLSLKYGEITLSMRQLINQQGSNFIIALNAESFIEVEVLKTSLVRALIYEHKALNNRIEKPVYVFEKLDSNSNYVSDKIYISKTGDCVRILIHYSLIGELAIRYINLSNLGFDVRFGYEDLPYHFAELTYPSESRIEAIDKLMAFLTI